MLLADRGGDPPNPPLLLARGNDPPNPPLLPASAG
jgi:hypothetical protein